MSYILFKKVEHPADPTNKDLGNRTYPVIVYKYSNAATLKEIAKMISTHSGLSQGTSQNTLKDFCTYLKEILLSGRALNIDGLGYFYLAAQSKGTEKRGDFTAADITGLRICFRANNDIRLHTAAGTRTEGLTLKDVDRLNESGAGKEPGGDGGGGEIVDPMG